MNTSPAFYLQSFPFASELCLALRRIEAAKASTLRPIWLKTITQTAKILSGDAHSIRTFVEAWQSFYSVTVFLDHTQPQALTLGRALRATESQTADSIRWAVIFDHYAQAIRKAAAHGAVHPS
jgi:hypothetical protein